MVRLPSALHFPERRPECTRRAAPLRPVEHRRGISGQFCSDGVQKIMCGRFTRFHKPEEITERFDVETIEEAATLRYNIAPSQIVPVIRQVEKREMIACKWGWSLSGRKTPKSAIR